MTRVCRLCKVEKLLELFVADRRYAQGRRPECKQCFHEIGRKNKRKDRVLPETKVCKKCGTEKHSVDFDLDSRTPDGLRNHCRSCNTNRTPEEQRRDLRARQLRFHYGMTVEDYDALWETQGGVCASCKEPEPESERKKYLAVDHCHDTGRVRGLLCNRCNTALGLLDENPEKILALVAYLAAVHA